jgi:hypothetical protein
MYGEVLHATDRTPAARKSATQSRWRAYNSGGFPTRISGTFSGALTGRGHGVSSGILR